MKLKTNNIKIWNVIVSTVNGLGSVEMFVKIRKNGLFIKGLSGCQSMGYQYVLSAKDFLEYDFSGEEIVVCVAVQKIHDVIKRAEDKNCELCMSLIEDNKFLKVEIKRKRKSSYKIPLIEFDEENKMDEKINEYGSSLLVNIKEIVSALGDLVFDTPSMALSMDKNSLTLRDNTETNPLTVVRMRKSNNLSIVLGDKIDSVKGLYDPNRIVGFLNNLMKLSEMAKIEFDYDFPMQISVKDGSSMIRYMIAPRVPND